MSSTEIQIIVPAAGFGRRVGSPESKEMFFRSNGERLIDLPIKLAKTNSWPVLVLSREEKQELNQYLTRHNYSREIQVHCVGVTSDWPETLLKSEAKWKDWNIVVLPDTEFSPMTILEGFEELVKNSQFDVVAWIHSVEKEDLSQWGYICSIDNKVYLSEKPKKPLSDQAWGLFAFHKSKGRELLALQKESNQDHQWKAADFRVKLIQLNAFKDLTRGKPR